MELPRDVLVEIFLVLSSFFERRKAALVSKEWRVAHAEMHRMRSRKARYAHFQFQISQEIVGSFLVSQGFHGPMVQSTGVTTKRITPGPVDMSTFLSEPQPTVGKVKKCYLSYMLDNGALAHPWTWISPKIWSKEGFLKREELIITQEEGFGAWFCLTAPFEDDEAFQLKVFWKLSDGTAQSCTREIYDLTGSISAIIFRILQVITIHIVKRQEILTLLFDYPFGMLEHLHKYWEPCLGLREGDTLGTKLCWRE